MRLLLDTFLSFGRHVVQKTLPQSVQVLLRDMKENLLPHMSQLMAADGGVVMGGGSEDR